jgi:hypothetical protein
MTSSSHGRDESGPLGTEASPGTPGDSYPDSNERDIDAKQSTATTDSAAFDDPEVDASKVEVLPGTGGPDDVGYTEVEPDDYDPTGHANVSA